MVNLESLIIFGDKIIEIPKEIGNLVNLKTLFIGGDQLIVIPDEVIYLTNMEDLVLQTHQNFIFSEKQTKWIETIEDSSVSIGNSPPI